MMPRSPNLASAALIPQYGGCNRMKKVKLTGYRLHEYGTIDRQPAT